jgi:tripeptide aminopeptidase
VKLNEQNAIDRVLKLMSVSGVSCREQAVSDLIRKMLEQAGVPASAIEVDSAHQRSPAGGETGNLIVWLKGTRRGPRRLLMAHMDTVPLAAGCVPVRKGDWIHPASGQTALGGDNRAGCAAVLTAIIETLEQKIDYPPLTLLFTVQEEIGLRGARFLNPSKLGNPELCFNWDGRVATDFIVGAVGANNLQIVVDGIASHAGVHPENGVNALVVASLAIADLQSQGWHGLVLKGRQRGTSNIGIVSGGDATNVVMPQVQLQAEARSHNAAFCRRIVSAYRKAFDRAAKQVSSADRRRAQVTFQEDLRYDAFRIKPSAGCVQSAIKVADVLGVSHSISVCNGGLDANWMTAHGFPTVTLGCGQHEIHTVNERLHLPDFLRACSISLMLATAADERLECRIDNR